ncbi:TetR/AcrR family transcriptional regulator [Noviherbaspirillum suwonense]|uniref:Transcriptional regulator, TetR family n=1 Tax=Noviherbaspirillum suwonense TaxID=1224511 RepID=A0ABY1QAM4_9BURK|nr:TetR/AcrR family transcriptional regulator [Noviherbaspirillum suwonense]SMP63356.1 transcriptional regulator, TetR family [Noviherbaspirillum suwonense]
MRKKTATANQETEAAGEQAVPSRKRLSVEEREKQILASAIQFFSEHGLNGQMRVLAQQMGITHTLFYHYFPTKQALLDRVYYELFEGRWKPEWQTLLDDSALDPEEKLVRFYCDYAQTILTRDFVRIFIYSGLSDHYIPDRFFALLRTKLFPRLVRETRRYRGITSRARPSVREIELLMGLHGGIFYTGVRRWIYGQEIPSSARDPDGIALITDRVRSYLLSAPAVLDGDKAAATKTRKSRQKET